jgi:hypothetical protein
MLGILYSVDGSTNVVEVKCFTDIQKHINGYAGVLSLKDGYYAYDEEALIRGAAENKHLALEDILPCKMYGPILYLTEGWKELPYESI